MDSQETFLRESSFHASLVAVSFLRHSLSSFSPPSCPFLTNLLSSHLAWEIHWMNLDRLIDQTFPPLSQPLPPPPRASTRYSTTCTGLSERRNEGRERASTVGSLRDECGRDAGETRSSRCYGGVEGFRRTDDQGQSFPPLSHEGRTRVRLTQNLPCRGQVPT